MVAPADRISNELADLVAILTPMLGDITSINVNWQPLQRPPDFNWPGWDQKRHHVMTIGGGDRRVNLLIIPYATYSALALMVLRRAADPASQCRRPGQARLRYRGVDFARRPTATRQL